MLEKAMGEFEKYSNQFDMDDLNIKLKYEHTLKVMNLCREIGERLLLSIEELEICQLIGLLHDLGRFEQLKQYNTFNDKKSFDHAGYAVNLLFDQNLIRKFIKSNKYDDIIKDSIYFHNKYNVPDYLDDRTKMFCKIIRDADKIDILRVMVEEKHLLKDIIIEPSEEVLSSYFNYKQVNKEIIKNYTDGVVLHIAIIFDLNYKYSYTYIIDNNYFNKYFEIIQLKNDKVKIIFDKIQEVGNEYLKRKVGL